MKRGKQIDTWFPMFIDKWLFGSTRHELIIQDGETWLDLRGIFTDLLTLSKKDGGFIRANETTPYPISQLSGMFCVPEIHLKRCIDLCLKFEKLQEVSPGIYFIKSTGTYSLTDRHKRRMSDYSDMMSENVDSDGNCSDIREKEKRGEKRIGEENKKGDVDASRYGINSADLEKEFANGFWKVYPVKASRADALSAYKKLRATVSEKEIADAFDGYVQFLKHQRLHKKFNQNAMYPATFLRKERWRDYVGFVYRPKL